MRSERRTARVCALPSNSANPKLALRFTAVLIQEGRAASVRAEVFAPGSLVWSASGIAICGQSI